MFALQLRLEPYQVPLLEVWCRHIITSSSCPKLTVQMDRLDKQRDRKERCGKATSRANVKTAAKLARRYGVTSSTYQLNLESRKSKNTFRREEKSAGLFSQLKATYDLSTALHSYMFYSGSKQHISSCCITQVARGQEMAPLLDLTPLGCSMSRCLESQFLKPLFYLSLILLKA